MYVGNVKNKKIVNRRKKIEAGDRSKRGTRASHINKTLLVIVPLHSNCITSS
jgi:hypothetical protein